MRIKGVKEKKEKCRIITYAYERLVLLISLVNEFGKCLFIAPVADILRYNIIHKIKE